MHESANEKRAEYPDDHCEPEQPPSFTPSLARWEADEWGTAAAVSLHAGCCQAAPAWVQAASSGYSPTPKIQFREYSSVTNVLSSELVHVKMSPLPVLDIRLSEDQPTAIPLQHGATRCQPWQWCCWLAVPVLSSQHVHHLPLSHCNCWSHTNGSPTFTLCCCIKNAQAGS